MAAEPYGTANLPIDSLDEIIFSCSGVGPALGYVNSVRTAVYVNGAEIEFKDIREGELSRAEAPPLCSVDCDF